MIKINDYVKVKKGAFPFGSPYPISNIVGKVQAVINGLAILQLDAPSLLDLSLDMEEYFTIEGDDRVIMIFDISDCTPTKRRDTDKEYQKAFSDFVLKDGDFDDDFDFDFDGDMEDGEEYQSMLKILSQAFPIAQFQQSPFFEQLSDQEKEWHVKIIDAYTQLLMNLTDLHKNFEGNPEDKDLSIVYHDESISVLMTEILGQEVAYPIQFFNYFVNVISKYTEFIAIFNLVSNKDEILNSLKKYNMKMLAIAKSPKYWIKEKQEKMKLLEQGENVIRSESELFFDFLKEQNIDISHFEELFKEE